LEAILDSVNVTSATTTTFAYRLHQARAMQGLSLRELAARVSSLVSHNALAKYEKGVMLPGSEVLIALAEALVQPVDFFFRSSTVKVEQVRFRKKARLSVGRQKAVRELAIDYLERYHEAEELVGDVRRFERPATLKLVATEADAERAAGELRKAWNLGSDPLGNVFELMESKGIKVLEVSEESGDFDGLSADTDVGPVIVLGSHLNRNLPRKRMTEVHELGHVAVPVAQGIPEKLEEKLIASFAGAFLLPADTFTDAFGRNRQRFTLAEVVNLKAHFGVSIMAIMHRAQVLGLITPQTYTRFCMHASSEGWRMKGEPGDDRYAGCESDGRFRQLVRRAISEEYISLSKGAALLREPLGKVRKELELTIG
jgi:Zn-dependent peptidase ImmA (M78 family)/transcriptional regulator with XRE-family HTH domain